ncbi:hypothetical protein EV663_101482 [Rhodovulum bhavnagarense]|uniref:VWFA domain-containing protein n=1 Tax=Rhodovulum bhavnagarense TaxID=992286 RepID=A0A4R2RJZ6_9RHOB|nr:VWA domain-containing protein [Rhodovulum bhavnagarense]TCP63214.1 hypothetical protein EV663_101482 [Rhodovulum bhavnagarense]
MADLPALQIPEDGKLAHNVLHFARALRLAGLPVGPGRVIDAIRAVEAAGFSERGDFYHTLAACFLSRPEHRQVYDQVFRLYWRDPRFLEHMMSLMLPAMRGVAEDRKARAAEKRAAEALLDGAGRPPDLPVPDESGQQVEIDARQTQSARERLKTLDFEQMSLTEIAEARRMLTDLRLPVPPIRTRRTRPASHGQLPDWRATMRMALRHGGELRDLSFKNRRVRWPNLVVLCDISGSMSQYSRMVLHFVHAVANNRGAGWDRVHAFTFGTRLTNITRTLANRDVDAALAAAGAQAPDWEGGTRIAAALHAFNRDWSRRVLGSGAVVLLITDGLDRDAGDRLCAEMERLHLSCQRLIWINPLLRWEGFAPRACGIRAMLPHVDCFRAGHSIRALEDLAAALSSARDSGERDRMLALMRNS